MNLVHTRPLNNSQEIESPEDDFNDPRLNDCELIINDKKKGGNVVLYVSKWLLGKNSVYFRDLLDNNPDKKQIAIELLPGVKLEIFLDMIKTAYKKDIDAKNVYSVFKVAHKYQLECAIKRCGKIMVKTFEMSLESSKRLNSLSPRDLELACKVLKYLNQQELKNCSDVHKNLHSKATSAIIGKFKTIREVFLYSDEFRKLPLDALLVILQSDEFVVDSENSVFYFSMVWLQQFAGEEKNKKMGKILPEIRFPHMRIHFLLDIVPHVANTFQFSDSIKKEIDGMYSIALEYKYGGKNRLERFRNWKYPKQFVPRPTIENAHTFTIRCQFVEVEKWELSARYYSAPVLSHGYEFYFFLRKQRLPSGVCLDKVDQPHECTLAGFLRCTSKLLPPRHYLPICSTVHIPMRGPAPSERRFSPSKVIFEASEKAIGGKLTLQSEDWISITRSDCPLVINNTITVIVNVEFLDSAEGCQTIDETTD